MMWGKRGVGRYNPEVINQPATKHERGLTDFM